MNPTHRSTLTVTGRLRDVAAKLPLPLVLTAFDAVQSSRDGAYPLLQEANFLWLTGISQPGWRVIITSERSYLVAPLRSEMQQVFDGGLSHQEALRISGADEIISPEAARTLLKTFAKDGGAIYTLGEDPSAAHYDFVLNPAPATLRCELEELGATVRDARPQLSALRAIKTDSEIAIMRAAIETTGRAFERVRVYMGYQYEYEVEADMTHALRTDGARGHAYEPIVAGGANALTLHYCTNNDPLPKDGLVLIDVGARTGAYAADITRTYAIGTPTKREIAVHAAVQRAHEKIIALVRPGLLFADYHAQVDEIMKDELQKLQLLGSRDDTKTYRTYFPHAISHGLGIDVHESLGGFDAFQPGMIFTVEPGIYIPEEGIGVRIEDDILVTPTGHENLSAFIPTAL